MTIPVKIELYHGDGYPSKATIPYKIVIKQEKIYTPKHAFYTYLLLFFPDFKQLI